MRLTKAEFDALKKDNRLKIALIGMSNIGKSHWTAQIKDVHGFAAYEVDEKIQGRLSLASIAESADWMGHPHEKDYAEKSVKYMQLESELTLGAKDVIGNVVLDTTGSVIHISLADKQMIRDNFLVVYLQANNDAVNVLVKRFNQSPKPLIWGELYTRNDELSDNENLLSCYPNLLKSRAVLYEDLSDIVLDVSALKDTHSTDFLEALRNALPNCTN